MLLRLDSSTTSFRGRALPAADRVCCFATPASGQSGFKPPAEIQAVISDVDGTLFAFGTNRQLSAANLAALQRASGAGCHVCLATGRIPGPWSEAIRAQLPELGAGVFSNGALVIGPDGEVIEESTLPADAAAAVREYTLGGRCRGRRVSLLAATRWEPDDGSDPYVRYVELSPDGETWVTQLIRSAAEPEVVLTREFDQKRYYNKFVFFTNPDDDDWVSMPDALSDLRDILAGTGVEIVDCGARQCEILPPGVNKGTGVAKLLQHLGNVSPQAVLACGDAENDVEMLRLAGVGVAMGNAKPQALAAADVVVASNDDDGVAEAIHRFVLKDKDVNA